MCKINADNARDGIHNVCKNGRMQAYVPTGEIPQKMYLLTKNLHIQRCEISCFFSDIML